MKAASRILLVVLLSSLLAGLTSAFPVIGQPVSVGMLLTKKASATKVLSGSSVSYLYNVTNTGQSALTGNITDDVYGTVGYFVNLQPGGWVGFNVTHVITVNTTNVATAMAVDPFGSVVTDSAVAFVQVYYSISTIESCDSTGTTKDTFDISDYVYVKGSGYSPLTFYDLYVVEDELVWINGMAIPNRISGTASFVFSDAGGNIQSTLTWIGPLVFGKYDIVVDVNGNGVYDVDVDALDDMDVEISAGFFVVPEFWLGTLLGLGGCFAALGVFLFSKRKSK